MVIQRSPPLANDHPEWSAICKLLSGMAGLLQMILVIAAFLPKVSPAQSQPHTKCQLLNGRFLKLSSPLLGSTSSTLHHRPRIMSGQIHVARVYPKVDKENKQRGLFHSRIGTSCILFKLKECALGLARHLSHHGIWQDFRLFSDRKYFVQDSNCE